jgi:hypothetical protein
MTCSWNGSKDVIDYAFGSISFSNCGSTSGMVGELVREIVY